MNSLINESEDPAQQLVQLRQRVAELELALQEEQARHREAEAWFGQTQQKYMEILESSTLGTALAESERKYYDLFNSIDEGFCIVEVLFDDNDHPLDYRFLEVNQAFERQTGLVAAAGRCMREMAPRHEQHWFDIYGRIALTGEPARFCNPAQALGFIYDVYAFRVGQPEQRRVAILFKDIKEIKEAMEALRKSEEKYRTLFESSVFGFVVIEPLFDENGKVNDLRYLQVNPAFQEVTGLRTVDFLGKRLREAFPGMEPEWLEVFEQVVKTGRPERFEDYSRGSGQWYEIAVFPHSNGLLGQQLINITRRKQAEEEVRQARDYLEEKVAERTAQLSLERQRLFDVLETLPANIFLLSSDYKVQFANRAYLERYGEPNGRCCYDFIFGLDNPCEQCETLRPLETGQPHNWIFTAPNGNISEIHNFPFTDVDGQSMVLDMNVDITDKQRTERELARLDRLNLIGQMAAGIGHEIRNPMTTVRGFLQMLGDKPEYAEDRDFFELMIEELDRANGIISEFLGLARDKKVDLQPGSLKRVVKPLYPMIRSDANLQEIDVKLDLHSAPQVLIDKNEIRQLILNLSRNAMEAMSSHGTLTIGTRAEGNEAVLYIRDEGSGMDPETIDKLGTPFHTTKDKGTGLGLAVCYSIAARHNARIDFETGPEGTTFYVRFPLAVGLAADQMEISGRGGVI